jgi:hypothetical protein
VRHSVGMNGERPSYIIVGSGVPTARGTSGAAAAWQSAQARARECSWNEDDEEANLMLQHLRGLGPNVDNSCSVAVGQCSLHNVP